MIWFTAFFIHYYPKSDFSHSLFPHNGSLKYIKHTTVWFPLQNTVNMLISEWKSDNNNTFFDCCCCQYAKRRKRKIQNDNNNNKTWAIDLWFKSQHAIRQTYVRYHQGQSIILRAFVMFISGHTSSCSSSIFKTKKQVCHFAIYE